MSTEPIRTQEPDRLTQGESAEWKRSFCDYPATLWTLEYRFRGPGTGFDVTATADGTEFDAVITATRSATMSPGKYEWQAWATDIADTSIVRKIGEGTTEIERGFTHASTGTVELRSTAKQILDAIDATLLGNATSDQMSYEITTPAGTTKVSKFSRSDLLSLRKEYAGIVARENTIERAKQTGRIGKSFEVRMP